MGIKICTLVLLSLLLASCSYFNPPFNKPTVYLPYPKNHKSKPINLSTYAWWKKLGDKKLNVLMRHALQQNDQLVESKQNVLAAKADLEKTKMGWVPELGASGTVGYGRLTHFDLENKSGNSLINSLASEDIKSYTLTQPAASMSYNLNLLQQYQEVKLSKVNVQIEKQLDHAAKLAVINQLSVAYFSLIGAKKQLAIQNDIIESRHKLYQDELYALHNGLANSQDVERAKQDWAESKIARYELEYNIKKYKNAIKILTNNFRHKPNVSNHFPLVMPAILGNLNSQVLEHRPDVALAEYQLKAANADIAIARSAFFPSIALTSAFGALSFELRNLLALNAGLWSSSARLNIPLLNFKDFANAKQAEIKYKSAYYHYIYTVKQAFTNVDDDLTQYQSAKDTVHSSESVFVNAQQLFEHDKLAYKIGELDYMPVLKQRIEYDLTKIKFIEDQTNLLNNMSVVYESLGAGYQYPVTKK